MSSTVKPFEYVTYASQGSKCVNCGIPLGRDDLAIRSQKDGLSEAVYRHQEPKNCKTLAKES